MSSVNAPSVTALGPKPVTKPNAIAAKVTMPLYAVAFKWIRILFACWKQRIPYDPDRYLKALQNRGSQYAQTTA